VDSAAALGAVESSMTHISGHDRSRMFLLPEVIDDYVVSDNPVRFIDAFVDEPNGIVDAFVDGLDLAAAGFKRVTPKATGRLGYAPADLLKLHIHGYLNRVRSSRRLEAECHRNIEVIWLLWSLKPDFKTIADFRRDNRAAFRSVFREFVLPCRRLSVEVSPRNFRGFHTVCKGFAVVFSVEWLLRNGRARQSPGVQEIWHVLGQQEAVRLCFHFGSEIGHGR
jgi:transposase